MSAQIIQFPDQARLRAIGPVEQSDDGWFRQASDVLDQIEQKLDAGAAQEVVTLCEQATRCLLHAAPEIDDFDAVVELIDRLGDLHVRAVRAAIARSHHPSAV
jgi:hypothetical protein